MSASSTPRPNPDWIDGLPQDRCIAEFSMWSANLARLEDDLSRIEPHADVLHLDVADGVFAPAFLMFPDMTLAIRERTHLPIHVHLMCHSAILLDQIGQFAEAGADLISIHVENASVAHQAFDLLESRAIAAGMVLRVETPVGDIAPYVERLDFLTLLGTAIGVKGQGLASNALQRLTQANDLIAGRDNRRRCVVAADGGIREHTVPALIASGAQSVVLGSLAFGAPNLTERMQWLSSLGS